MSNAHFYGTHQFCNGVLFSAKSLGHAAATEAVKALMAAHPINATPYTYPDWETCEVLPRGKRATVHFHKEGEDMRLHIVAKVRLRRKGAGWEVLQLS